jgi:hypothetical protein
VCVCVCVCVCAIHTAVLWLCVSQYRLIEDDGALLGEGVCACMRARALAGFNLWTVLCNDDAIDLVVDHMKVRICCLFVEAQVVIHSNTHWLSLNKCHLF